MARKMRSDCTVRTFERKHGLPSGQLGIRTAEILGAINLSVQSEKKLKKDQNN